MTEKKSSVFSDMMRRHRALRALPPKSNNAPAAEPCPSELSKQIIAAAARARGEILVPAANITGTAKGIIDAAVLRDAGGHKLPALTGTAKLIVEAGRKARGEDV